MLAVIPTDRRVASAVRRFPQGCGRPRNAAAQKPPRPLPSSTTKPPIPNPSTTPAAPPPRRTVPAAASSGSVGTDRGVGNGSEAAAAVTVRRASAVRRYPPGCGRSVAVAVAKPRASVVESEGDAGRRKPPVDSCTGIEAKAEACDREAVVCECAIDDGNGMENGGGRGVVIAVAKPPALLVESEGEAGTGKQPVELCNEAKAKASARKATLYECAIGDGEFSSDDGMENGVSGEDSGAQEEGGGKPWVVTGLMAAPFVPWAQHGRRSPRPEA